MESHQQKKIAIFASGSGSNAENIYRYFEGSDIEVLYLVCNNSNAGVLKRFENKKVTTILIDKEELNLQHFINRMKELDLIVLAGFLLLIPASLIQACSGKIINIHPALLPKYGGKGMYGDHVHRAVLKNGEKEHGITIHYVNEKFDDGEVIFQEKFIVDKTDDLQTIQTKIHDLEFKWYPKIIERLLSEDL